ncbi:MAG: hypothetical protein ACPL3P_08320 [Anaerolineales bacterium]
MIAGSVGRQPVPRPFLGGVSVHSLALATQPAATISARSVDGRSSRRTEIHSFGLRYTAPCHPQQPAGRVGGCSSRRTETHLLIQLADLFIVTRWILIS